MTTTAPALTITCAKPDCHWAGSAADAPTHDCPTPAVNKNVNTSTPEIGEAERLSFAAERADIEQRLQAAGVEYSADLSLEDLRGLAQLLVDPIEEKAEPTAEPAPDPAAVEAEPPKKRGRGRKAAELAAAIAEKTDTPPGPLEQAGEALTDAVATLIDRGLREQGKPTLFDTDNYRDPALALPQIDGHNIDRIAIRFGGETMLDRSDPAHVALWRRVKLGQKIELWVEAKGLGYEGKGATNKDGELDVIVAKRSVSVQHVRVLGPEDLKEAALEVASQARDAAEDQDARDRAKDADQ